MYFSTKVRIHLYVLFDKSTDTLGDSLNIFYIYISWYIKVMRRIYYCHSYSSYYHYYYDVGSPSATHLGISQKNQNYEKYFLFDKYKCLIMTYVGFPYNLEVQIDPLIFTFEITKKTSKRIPAYPKRIPTYPNFKKLKKSQDTLKWVSDTYWIRIHGPMRCI